MPTYCSESFNKFSIFELHAAFRDDINATLIVMNIQPTTKPPHK
jgi:hypothetical protein